MYVSVHVAIKFKRSIYISNTGNVQVIVVMLPKGDQSTGIHNLKIVKKTHNF